MKFGSACSGIEAASVAWHPLGWNASFLSEIEPFARSVLTHHYPDIPLHGDFTTIRKGQYDAIDVLVGGTPCQSFSVAGLRKGLDDPRGNLMLGYLALADKYRPDWVVWENVPGVLSSNGGRDFGTFLGGLGQLGYGFAYRVLDAQYFGVPQRRRRVFVVGCAGDWRRAAAVLFERHSLQGNPAPSRQAGERIAPTLDVRAGRSGETSFHTSGGLIGGVDYENNGHGPYDVTGPLLKGSPTGGGRPLPAIALFKAGQGSKAGGIGYSEHVSPTLSSADSGSNRTPALMRGMQVRRLTPVECERLQGFKDNYTLVPHRGKPAADGPRYKALGNSMAVPCMEWLGQRIQAVSGVERLEIAA